MDKLFVGIIILALFAQLFMIDRTQEPYPAILLPGGGTTIKNSDNISVNEHKLMVYKSDSAYRLIDKTELMNTMPKHYTIYVLRNMFGLPVNEVAAKYADKAKVKKGKKWLRKRIKQITGWQQVQSLEILVLEKTLFLSKNKLDSTKTEKVLSLIKFDLTDVTD